MKERILSNWTFVRGFYLVIGLAVLAQSIVSQHWMGLLVGGYFASMGLFAFGCAAGNCYGGQASSTADHLDSNDEVKFEELHKQ
ncbi:MAG TPA: hypothetical protein PKD85_03885 [Saprospiraceae bacterium]|nr:hypothetical protein [Saprospiraceae bacterium]